MIGPLSILARWHPPAGAKRRPGDVGSWKRLNQIDSDDLKWVLGEGPAWKTDMAELLLRMERSTEAREYLTEASSQLATLRQTPARRDLAKRIATIEASIDTPPDDGSETR